VIGVVVNFIVRTGIASSRPERSSRPVIGGAPYKPPVPPIIDGLTPVAIGGGVAVGDHPVGSFGGPGALKLPDGRV